MTRYQETVPTLVFPLPGGGNPGPVVIGGDALTTNEMREHAERLGVETAFALTATRPDCLLRLRYFVPKAELQMCVHATIAAVTVLARRGIIVPENASGALIESPLGPLPVTWTKTHEGLAVTVEQFTPMLGESIDPRGRDAALVMDALRCDLRTLDLEAGPLQVASVSRSKIMVPVHDARTLDALTPDWETLWRVCETLGVTGIYAFTSRPRNPLAADIDARQFPLRAGYVEDPATGVAAAALAACLDHAGKLRADPSDDGWRRIRIEQGHAMGRPCSLEAQVQRTSDGVVLTRVRGYAKVLDQVSWAAL